MDLKQQILAVINVEQEARDILGSKAPNGNYKCYNKAAHNSGDSNPSLSMSHEGLYLCHACGVKGDVFQLIMDSRGMDRSADFGTLLKSLAAKYSLQANTVRFEKKRKVKQIVKGFKLLNDIKKQQWLFSRRGIPVDVYQHLFDNYGLHNATVDRYGMGYKDKRLWIPIPAKDFERREPVKTKMINVRKHDVMRACCKFVDGGGNIFDAPAKDTKPYWGERGGKTIGIRGHNVAYVYPMMPLTVNAEVWLVGGELKALLMNQMGIPAICFTAGEGRYHKQLLKLFTNKIVRVVMDIDEAGERATFGHKDKPGLCQVLADNGAKEVYGGRLPPEGMPHNGDITDYLRIHKWDTKALDKVEWEKFEPKPLFEAGFSEQQTPKYEFPDFDDVPFGSFANLLKAKNGGKVIKVPFVVAGRGETPYLLPSGVSASCEAGQMDVRQICAVCPMSRNNFEMSVRLTEEERIDLVGKTPMKVKSDVSKRLGLPKCQYPEVNIESDSVERLIIIPTLDSNSSGDQFNYRQHAIYALGDKYLTENVSYEGVGMVLPEPKNSQYTWAMPKSRAMDNDIFNYKHKEDMAVKLREVFHHDTLEEKIGALVTTLKDNHLHKHGIDKLILYELLAFFMPFEFSLGKYKNYKVCPEVCILGEPRSGKSSTAKDLLTLFGAGRYVDAPTVTTVGLIGGNSNFGKTNIFTWGAIPMCHRAICIIDECNKLSIESIETLTNLRSSGVAERTTASGIRKIRANVRFLWLCNPRGGRSLSHYGSPVRAAQEVFGSPQDLARLDLLHIQKAVQSAREVNSFHKSTSEDWYSKSLARYQLQWAWSLKEHDVVFEDEIYIMDKAIDLVERFKTDLLPMAETKFKIARIAAGLASLAYSTDKYNRCFVTNEAVDMAHGLLEGYKEYNISELSQSGAEIPDELRTVLEQLPPNEVKRLKAFMVQDMLTMSELKDLFGPTWTVNFIQTTFYEMGIVTRRRQYFMWDQQLRGYLGQYIENPTRTWRQDY